jgi:hypothetical protein
MERNTVVKGTPFFEHGICTALNEHFGWSARIEGGLRGEVKVRGEWSKRLER